MCEKLVKEKGKEFIVGLDHNLDLLKHHVHLATQDFLKLLYEMKLLPCITRPTRITHNSSTLIDNIFLSPKLHSVQLSCIILSDLSDHMPCSDYTTKLSSKL